MIDTVEHFKKEKYAVIDNFVDNDTSFLLYHYVKTLVQSINYKFTYQNEYYQKELDGQFQDPQAPGDFSKYGDPLFDTLLNLTCDKMSRITGLNLTPQYSYHRLYTTDSELVRHVDRPSCEVSATLCLGYDSDYEWPICLKKLDGTEVGYNLKPGSALVYRGCDVEHWREKFKGKHHAQVFFHYNETGGKYDNVYDGRPLLGINNRV